MGYNDRDSSNNDSKFQVCFTTTPQNIQTHNAGINKIIKSSNDHLLTACRDGYVRSFLINKNANNHRSTTNSKPENYNSCPVIQYENILTEHCAWVNDIEILSNRKIISVGNDGCVNISGQKNALYQHNDYIKCVTLAKNIQNNINSSGDHHQSGPLANNNNNNNPTSKIFTGGLDCVIKSCDLVKSSTVVDLHRTADSIYALQASNFFGDSLLAFGTSGGLVETIDIRNRKTVFSEIIKNQKYMSYQKSVISNIKFLQNHQMLVADYTGFLNIFDLRKGILAQNLQCGSGISSLELDSEFIYAGLLNGEILRTPLSSCLYNSKSNNNLEGQIFAEFPNGSAVTGIIPYGKGAFLATSNNDSNVYLLADEIIDANDHVNNFGLSLQNSHSDNTIPSNRSTIRAVSTSKSEITIENEQNCVTMSSNFLNYQANIAIQGEPYYKRVQVLEDKQYFATLKSNDTMEIFHVLSMQVVRTIKNISKLKFSDDTNNNENRHIFERLVEKFNRFVYVPSWFTIDLRVGRPTICLESSSVANAWVYLENENERKNLGVQMSSILRRSRLNKNAINYNKPRSYQSTSTSDRDFEYSIYNLDYSEIILQNLQFWVCSQTGKLLYNHVPRWFDSLPDENNNNNNNSHHNNNNDSRIKTPAKAYFYLKDKRTEEEDVERAENDPNYLGNDNQDKLSANNTCLIKKISHHVHTILEKNNNHSNIELTEDECMKKYRITCNGRELQGYDDLRTVQYKIWNQNRSGVMTIYYERRL